MPEPPVYANRRNVLVTAAALVILVAGLRAGQAIILPLLLAAFVAILCIPLLSWLTRHRVPPFVAVFLVILVAILGLAGVALVVGSSVNDFTDRVPFYEKRFKLLHAGTQAWLTEVGIPITFDRLYAVANPGTIMGIVSAALTAMAATLSNLLLVLFVVIFILLEAGGFRKKMVAALAARNNASDEATENRLQQLEEIVQNVQSYLAWKTLISIGTGLCVGFYCYFLGVDFPILWALLAFLLNFVPNIGSLLAAGPPVLLTLVQLGPGRALALTVGYVVINMIFGNVVEPLVLGRKLGLSSLVVFLSLIVWGFVWGPVGMLLSVPLTVMVRIGLEANPNTRWIAVLLGPSPESETPQKRGVHSRENRGVGRGVLAKIPHELDSPDARADDKTPHKTPHKTPDKTAREIHLAHRPLDDEE
jgi:AI-2 transport protein TqsA